MKLPLPGDRWLRYLAVAAVVLGVGAGSFVAFQYATASSLGDFYPPRDVYLDESELVVSASVPRFKPGSAEVIVLIDGKEVPAGELELVPGAVRLARNFSDGPHSVRVELSSSNIFSRRLVQSWGFRIDTRDPEVEILAPQPENQMGFARTAFRGRFSEPVEASLTVDGRDVVLSADGQTVWAELEPSEGRHELVLQAEDRAGNTLEKRWEAWADHDVPSMVIHPPENSVWKRAGGQIGVLVNDNMPEGLTVKASLDGALIDPRPGLPAPEAVVTGKKKRKATTTTTLPAGPGTWYTIELADLAEGNHRLAVRATDRGGHFVREEIAFLVDSTETFGSRPMVEGAQGRDARQLNRVLAHKGVLEGEPGDVFDSRTAEALVAFKQARGRAGGAILDQEILPLLLGSIVIDLSERNLYHYDEDKLVKTYRVAVGQPRYPTPRGDFQIISKEYNPTWNPPPSPWAAGLEPVPPGPGNPLGTRWMGLSSPSIGIHGTYASGSIGTAASHGCIRMHIRDVEELFELVYVGTPVKIVP